MSLFRHRTQSPRLDFRPKYPTAIHQEDGQRSATMSTQFKCPFLSKGDSSMKALSTLLKQLNWH